MHLHRLTVREAVSGRRSEFQHVSPDEAWAQLESQTSVNLASPHHLQLVEVPHIDVDATFLDVGAGVGVSPTPHTHLQTEMFSG